MTKDPDTFSNQADLVATARRLSAGPATTGTDSGRQVATDA